MRFNWCEFMRIKSLQIVCKYTYDFAFWAFFRQPEKFESDPVTRTRKMTQMTHWPGDPMTQFHVRTWPFHDACMTDRRADTTRPFLDACRILCGPRNNQSYFVTSASIQSDITYCTSDCVYLTRNWNYDFTPRVDSDLGRMQRRARHVACRHRQAAGTPTLTG